MSDTQPDDSRRPDPEQSTVTLPDGVGDFTAPAAVGERYQPVRLHARGGLGEVHLARDTELGRAVALKCVQARHAGEAANLRRFLREAEVTAWLEHPGIVPVYGLARDEAGRPAYAMRFVEGETLKEAAARHHAQARGRPAAGLAFRQLLTHFVAVCNAVAYAHSRGVIHRDLKPSNILLGKFGETLVVDWGLAKVVGRAETCEAAETPAADAEPAGDETEQGRALGTPVYMPPEQAAGQWDVVGPAADVYGLGATLYHVLTGRAPFAGGDASEVLDRVRRGACPPPRQVNPGVPRPLEAVCRRAMALDPADRYATATDLAADVERWLADEAVAAYREPAATRLGRWSRRHRARVAGAAGLAVAALVGLALLAAREYQGRRRLAGEHARTEEARDQARAYEREAREVVNKYLVSLAGLPPVGADVNQLRRDLLLEGRNYLQEFLRRRGGDDALQAELARARARLAQVLAALGEPVAAAAELQLALEAYRRLGQAHPEQPEHRREQARVQTDLADRLRETGRQVEAEAAAREALALHRQLVAADPADPPTRHGLARGLSSLALVCHETSRLEEARAAQQEAAAEFQRLADAYPRETSYRVGLARAHLNAGVALWRAGKLPEAEAALLQALPPMRVLARNHRDALSYQETLGVTYHHLGNVHLQADRFARAEEWFQKALGVVRTLAEDHPTVPQYRRHVASNLGNLVRVYGSTGRKEEARRANRECVAIYEDLVKRHPGVTYYAIDLGFALASQGWLCDSDGRPTEGLEFCARSLAVLEEELRRDERNLHVRHHLGRTHWTRAEILTGRKRPAEAVQDWDRALALGFEPAGVRLRRAYNLAQLGESERAVADTDEALRTRPASGEELALAAATFSLTATLPEQADRHAARAVALLREAFGKGHRDLARLQKDADFEKLRGRAEFQKLLADLTTAPGAGKKP
jgi:eukaryotic-like serine/threonine-protein kinase